MLYILSTDTLHHYYSTDDYHSLVSLINTAVCISSCSAKSGKTYLIFVLLYTDVSACDAFVYNRVIVYSSKNRKE